MRRTGLRVPGALLEYRGPDRWIERGIEFMNHRLSLILFTVLVVGGGLGIGFLTAPGDWYAQLKKPPFTPPGWIFGPTWTVLYVLIGGTGWWLWQRAHGEWLMKLWWTQLVLNFMWSPVFFGLRETRPRSRRDPPASRCNLGLHCHRVATAPRGGMALRALRRVGGLCICTERLDLRVQLS